MSRMITAGIAAMLGLLATMPSAAAPATATDGDIETFRSDLQAMKAAQRGPFRRIRWFCKDGSVLPPEPYACKEHGGGTQHGEWSVETLALRDAGYAIATFYTDLDIDGFVPARVASAEFAQMLIEQYLIRADDGWILRRAQFYRGAYQEEGERAGSRKLLLRMVADDELLSRRYLQLRIAASLLRHGKETNLVSRIRQEASSLAVADSAFTPLRNRIHARLSPKDAAAVRDYAAGRSDESDRAALEALAAMIDQAFGAESARTLASLLRVLEPYPQVTEEVGRLQPLLAEDSTASQRFTATASLLQIIREQIGNLRRASERLAMLDAANEVLSEHFIAGAALRTAPEPLSRHQQIARLLESAGALYGSGLLSKRQLGELEKNLGALPAQPVVLADYLEKLQVAGLAESWAAQTLQFFFKTGIDKLAEIEPLALLFVQDQMRGSPLVFFDYLSQRLLQDARALAGTPNLWFGEEIGSGIRPLNAGYAVAPLRIGMPEEDAGTLARQGIFVLPETVADLPPVAGIITAGAGNPLSHVQLLARNLGIPNVAVPEDLLAQLENYAGQRVELAVTRRGAVRIRLAGAEQLEQEVTAQPAATTLLRPDLDKLNLGQLDFVRLSELRARDSGSTVGPKAANLGELKFHYPAAVADGLVIPFGVFRQLLEQPFEDSGMTVFEWMVQSYAALARMEAGSPAHDRATETFRQRLENWLLEADPGDAFWARLDEALTAVFGPDGSFGVFVRSDTNVEDLPNFTGAGLNLTVANVVGFDAIKDAVVRVWASPFTRRAFAWRQSSMESPQHVYPAVLLMLSVDSDKSGVLVTRDLEADADGYFSIAVNEGIGGVVDGQAAESLRVNRDDFDVHVLAQASAPLRRQLDPEGGIARLPASGADSVLSDDEIRILMQFVRELPDRYPYITDADGNQRTMDIEFGFLDGKLVLFQIRPLVENEALASNEVLSGIDAAAADIRTIIVPMTEPLDEN
ncbi:MAG: hypothetical protein HKO62_02520 [Gammaproteobacteria bacterium]|nr:hypothetical protein [Gammaproteobacteria bacterium]